MPSRSAHLLAASLALVACARDTGPDGGAAGASPAIGDGEIAGRVCDASGVSWLQGAEVYTHIESGGEIIDTRVVYTESDGWYLLDGLPGGRVYDVFVQSGSERLLDQEHYGVELGEGEHIELPAPDCFDPLGVDFAIVTGVYDDFEGVLQVLGIDRYDVYDGLERDAVEGLLTDFEQLQRYDLVFFGGGHIEEGIYYPDSHDEYDDPDTPLAVDRSAEVMANLRAYVSGGGSIYVSDWAYDVVERGWPDRLDFVGPDEEPGGAQLGEPEEIRAAVSDASLAEWLGTNYLDLQYDLPAWAPIESAAGSVSVHLSGSASYRQGSETHQVSGAPLLASFSSGNGTVVYGTYPVASHASVDQLAVFQYMVFEIIEP